MSIPKHLLGLLLCAVLLAACGGDDDDDDAPSAGNGGANGSGATGSPAAACSAQCDAQEKVRGTGCEPFIELAACKQACTQLAKGIGSCGAQFSAYYDCSTADGFKCAGSLVINNTSACDDELSALGSCTSGGSGGAGAGTGSATCKGANLSGTCPQVTCPCPEGNKMVSGFDTTGDGCACLDSMTCKDLFCD